MLINECSLSVAVSPCDWEADRGTTKTKTNLQPDEAVEVRSLWGASWGVRERKLYIY